MKKLLSVLLAVCFLLSASASAFAAKGKVVYSGNSGKFIFAPGSAYSPTDLFPNFKDVMPGDSLTQKITVKNDADKKVKVKIYLRSLGARKESKDFLSKLSLQVKKSENNKMAYMFDDAASEKAQLKDWVCLGTLYSGGTVNLDVILNVPVELDNEYQEQIGVLDWEFRVDEFPIEPSDPKPPNTGDESNLGLWIGLMVASFSLLAALSVFFWLVFLKKKKKEEDDV